MAPQSAPLPGKVDSHLGTVDDLLRLPGLPGFGE
jgi:hypothetical protein